MNAISKMFVSHLADKGIRGIRVSSVKVTFHLKHLPDHSIHSDRAVSGLYGFTPTLYEIQKKSLKRYCTSALCYTGWAVLYGCIGQVLHSISTMDNTGKGMEYQ